MAEYLIQRVGSVVPCRTDAKVVGRVGYSDDAHLDRRSNPGQTVLD
jgi:hypothetical protein